MLCSNIGAGTTYRSRMHYTGSKRHIVSTEDVCTVQVPEQKVMEVTLTEEGYKDTETV
jgi:hypothetical protein